MCFHITMNDSLVKHHSGAFPVSPLNTTPGMTFGYVVLKLDSVSVELQNPFGMTAHMQPILVICMFYLFALPGDHVDGAEIPHLTLCRDSVSITNFCWHKQGRGY